MNFQFKKSLAAIMASGTLCLTSVSAAGTLVPSQANAQSDGSVNLFGLAWNAGVYVLSTAGWVFMTAGEAIQRGFSSGIPATTSPTDWQSRFYIYRTAQEGGFGQRVFVQYFYGSWDQCKAHATFLTSQSGVWHDCDI